MSLSVEVELALQRRAQVEEFLRKHRIGLLTLLFTDIVGSTQLKQDLGDALAVPLIQRHHSLVRSVLSDFNEAQEIGTEGDSFFIVFTRPSDAVRFALLLQARLREPAAGTQRPVFDRIGIHVGEVFMDQGAARTDVYGLQVDTAARILSLAQSGQTLLSRLAFDSARQILRGQEIQGLGQLSWVAHGHYQLKGIQDPVEVCEVGETKCAPLTRPTIAGQNTRRGAQTIPPDSVPPPGDICIDGIRGTTVASRELVVMRINDYPCVQAVLDDLYVNCLNDRFEPYTYGRSWILEEENIFSSCRRVLVPWSWLLSHPTAPGLLDEEWSLKKSPTECGLLPGTRWKLRDQFPLSAYGLAFDDDNFYSALRSSPKAAFLLRAIGVLAEVPLNDIKSQFKHRFVVTFHEAIRRGNHPDFATVQAAALTEEDRRRYHLNMDY